MLILLPFILVDNSLYLAKHFLFIGELAKLAVFLLIWSFGIGFAFLSTQIPPCSFHSGDISLLDHAIPKVPNTHAIGVGIFWKIGTSLKSTVSRTWPDSECTVMPILPQHIVQADLYSGSKLNLAQINDLLADMTLGKKSDSGFETLQIRGLVSTKLSLQLASHLSHFLSKDKHRMLFLPRMQYLQLHLGHSPRMIMFY